MKKTKNPTSMMPFVAAALGALAAAGAGYYFIVQRPRQKERRRVPQEPTPELPPPPPVCAPIEGVPHYRGAEAAGISCGTCRHFDSQNGVGHCMLFDVPVTALCVCNAFEPGDQPQAVPLLDIDGRQELNELEQTLGQGVPYVGIMSMVKGDTWSLVRSKLEHAAAGHPELTFLDMDLGRVLMDDDPTFEPKSDVIALLAGAWQRPDMCFGWLMAMEPPDAQQVLIDNGELGSFQFDCPLILVDANDDEAVAAAIAEAIQAAPTFVVWEAEGEPGEELPPGAEEPKQPGFGQFELV